MTTILAIETSTGLASAALLTDGHLLVRELSGVDTHSQGILPALQALLHEAGKTLNQCDALAFGCGPGAFTGIRTACGIVQGLAYGTELSVAPVVSLQAMALAAKEKHGGVDFVCILDARMEEVYWAHYLYADNRLQQISAPELSRIDDVSVSGLAKDAVIVAGEGVNLTDALHQFFHVECMPHAEYVARLGLLAYEAGLCVAPEDAQPLYLRNKIALTTAERMRAKANA